jgi:group I intron endonuclease
MKNKVAGIYLITSKINNKKYVGQSVNIGKRWQYHLNRLRAYKHPNNHLQSHFNKHLETNLTFEILEEVTDLTLLTEREQHYMDLLKPEFNQCPAAGSPLGYKFPEAKYYVYKKKSQQYETWYRVKGIKVSFSLHYTLEDTLKEIEYLKTLTEDELIKYKEECLAKPKKPKKSAKYYSFQNRSSRYIVVFTVNNKKKYFGSYLTEQDAIDRVKQVKLELGIE